MHRHFKHELKCAIFFVKFYFKLKIVLGGTEIPLSVLLLKMGQQICCAT